MSELAVKKFLDECRESGDRAYGMFKGVLERLQNEESRAETRMLLAAVQHYVDKEFANVDSLATFHFRIHELVLSNFEGFRKTRQKLTLLELPSIFIPEDWSFTFFEGINRLPDIGFQDRDVAELGCGNGWVSIAIAEKWSPRKVYGLDINPRAIKVAWINLYMNAMNEDGSLVLDREGKSLLDRVEFYVSDLLGHCRDNNIMLDRIVGCIPQVLNPDPEAMLKLVTENASEDYLYSLSNYCGLQGFVEDQFGLGLIARAAEEGIDVIKPSGTMIFNIGGRPGQAVCERLFQRRGFKIAKLWQTRVKQAADTDILALVEIEKNSRHRFEFFMGLLSEEPVCARTAWAYAKAGGEISHGLSVYQCQLRSPNEIKTIFKFLSNKSQEIRGALDLSFSDDSVAEEKIPFLAYLANAIEERPSFPYDLPGGNPRFRNLIAGFLRIYHGIPLTPNNVVVLPSRSILIENLVRLYQPHLALIDSNFTRWLPKKWLTALPEEAYFSGEQKRGIACCGDEISVIEAPRRADLVVQLIRRLKPQIIVTSLADFEMRVATAFEQLIEESEKIGARLVLDISDHIQLSSSPGTNGVLQYLALNALPLHVTIICGLVKNKVYSDLEVAFMISENKNILHAMALAGELVNGRTAVVSQFYYGCLLHELLSFHLPDRHTTLQRLVREEEENSKFISFAECTSKAILEAELWYPESKECGGEVVIHMDLDENALPTPQLVKTIMFEGFGRQNISEAETDPGIEILEFMTSKFSRNHSNVKKKTQQQQYQVVISESSRSLISNLIHACVEEKGTMCFPMGCNGGYISAAKFLNAKVRQISTKKEDKFKLTGSGVEEFITGNNIEKGWLYISGPTVNPTGAVYSDAEIRTILMVCRKLGVRVVLDTSFSGLEFEDDDDDGWEVEELVSDNEFALAVVGGISTEMMTGGHEFGMVVFTCPIFVEVFKEVSMKPHLTSKYMVKKVLGLWRSGVLKEGLNLQREILKERVKRMENVLKECGWELMESEGGISLVAWPKEYIEKKVMKNSEQVRDELFGVSGVCITSSLWIGIPNYCRFTYAMSEDKFEAALKALVSFKHHCFSPPSSST